MSWAERAWHLRRNNQVLRFTRYTIGSIVGAVVAEAAFLFSYALFDHIGPATASAIAFFAGAVPKYFLNRDWVWAERNGSRRSRELSRYAVVVVISIGVSAAATRFVEGHAGAVTHDHNLQVLLVGAAYAVTFVVLFFARYFVFDRLVFVDGGRRQDGGQHGNSDGGGTGGDSAPPTGAVPNGSQEEQPTDPSPGEPRERPTGSAEMPGDSTQGPGEMPGEQPTGAGERWIGPSPAVNSA